MMAAASIVSVLPSMNVSAASQTAKITFAYCHDGAGNAIRYQQTVTHDGRVCGEAGEARTRIYADGDPAFCIQPGVSLHTGNTLQANASETWNALSGSQRDAVNLALLYGSQGSMGSLPGSEDEKVVATQMVIWEIVTGCRNANAPYNQRLTNEMLPDEPESKVNACVNEVYRFWEEGKEQKLTQLLFCDLSTPKNDGTFSVYNDVRDKLIAKGIPPQEIEFIHDANTEVRKKELFSKVRRGAVRILMGSTFKMGAGTNVQNLIIASHDLDCPWVRLEVA